MPYKPIPGVYRIVNKANNKFYIGSAVSIHARFRQHRRLLSQNQHFNTHLQAAWNKYGENNFMFEIIESVPKELLMKAEQYWIDLCSVNTSKIGYNKRLQASTNLGIKASEQTRKKLSLAHIGHKRSPETQTKISATQSKPVCQIDSTGKIIKTYSSLQEAVKATGVHSPGISMCLNGTMQRTGGYYWCLKSNIESFKIPKPKQRKHPTKNIIQYDLAGIIVKEWSSITEIAREFNVSNSYMTLVLKSNKPYKNHIWKYKNSEGVFT